MPGVPVMTACYLVCSDYFNVRSYGIVAVRNDKLKIQGRHFEDSIQLTKSEHDQKCFNYSGKTVNYFANYKNRSNIVNRPCMASRQPNRAHWSFGA